MRFLQAAGAGVVKEITEEKETSRMEELEVEEEYHNNTEEVM